MMAKVRLRLISSMNAIICFDNCFRYFVSPEAIAWAVMFISSSRLSVYSLMSIGWCIMRSTLPGLRDERPFPMIR